MLNRPVGPAFGDRFIVLILPYSRCQLWNQQKAKKGPRFLRETKLPKVVNADYVTFGSFRHRSSPHRGVGGQSGCRAGLCPDPMVNKVLAAIPPPLPVLFQKGTVPVGKNRASRNASARSDKRERERSRLPKDSSISHLPTLGVLASAPLQRAPHPRTGRNRGLE
ncbi:hypothetical protein ZHAS_00007384 [Anopheles sinensis]|uniref:Uncharacterized protein n=1 Tax=Anopheles sinensis TaxID=74873 RepID=A0A084VPV1_ANOSI|nr:hypothetical protein ZHAS_00007384 [Anopheles sinensis]